MLAVEIWKVDFIMEKRIYLKPSIFFPTPLKKSHNTHHLASGFLLLHIRAETFSSVSKWLPQYLVGDTYSNSLGDSFTFGHLARH